MFAPEHSGGQRELCLQLRASGHPALSRTIGVLLGWGVELDRLDYIESTAPNIVKTHPIR